MDEEVQLQDLINSFGERIEAFKGNIDEKFAEETAHREEVERKVNKLRIHGAPSGDPDVDPVEIFKRAVKSWYPSRAQDAVDYPEYRKAFSKYVVAGIEVLSPDERKAMIVGSDAEGGYLVPVEFNREIIKTEHDNSVVRGIARTITIGADAVEFPESLVGLSVGWVGEVAARPATDSPPIGKRRFEPAEMYAMPEVSQKLLDDSGIDLEGFLAEEIGLAFAEEEDEQFIGGDGIIQPRGFTTYDTEATPDSAGSRNWGVIEHIATGQAGAWPTADKDTYDKLVDLSHALRPRYRRRAEWVMPTTALAKCRKLKDSQNNPIWQPSMMSGQPERLLGYPVQEAEQMPAVAADSLSVAFGDWQRAYWIIDRLGVRVLRDPYTNKPFVRFYTTKRTTGGVTDSNALKLLKFASS